MIYQNIFCSYLPTDCSPKHFRTSWPSQEDSTYLVDIYIYFCCYNVGVCVFACMRACVHECVTITSIVKGALLLFIESIFVACTMSLFVIICCVLKGFKGLHKYVHVHMLHTHMHTHMHTHKYTHPHTHIHPCTHARTHARTHAHTHTHTHTVQLGGTFSSPYSL